jgi:D-aminoacyl-tRNA deacylase
MAYPCIISSTKDLASQTIKKYLLDRAGWEPREAGQGVEELLFSTKLNSYLATVDVPLVECEFLDAAFASLNLDPLCYLFASRHSSESGRPALLAHVTGNWGADAALGGSPMATCRSSASLLRSAFLNIVKEKEANQGKLSAYSVNLEATHHGPTSLRKPLVFIELGSTESNWRDGKGGNAIANVISRMLGEMETCENSFEIMEKSLDGTGIGFGGLHYATTFEKMLRGTKGVGISHIIPKYAIDDLDSQTIKLAIENTVETVKWFILDWKGLNRSHKDKLIPMLERFNIPVKRAKRLRKAFKD